MPSTSSPAEPPPAGFNPALNNPPVYLPSILPTRSPLVQPILLDIFSSRLPAETILHIASYAVHPLLRHAGSENNCGSYVGSSSGFTDMAAFWDRGEEGKGETVAGVCVGIEVEVEGRSEEVPWWARTGALPVAGEETEDKTVKFTVSLAPSNSHPSRDETLQVPLHFAECRAAPGKSVVTMWVRRGENEAWDRFMNNLRVWEYVEFSIALKPVVPDRTWLVPWNRRGSFKLIGYQIGVYVL